MSAVKRNSSYVLFSNSEKLLYTIFISQSSDILFTFGKVSRISTNYFFTN